MSHLHEQIDFTVEVFVVYEGKVLLRKHDKRHIWLSVGGHIELDEDPNQAAVREVKEEVGLDIELLDSRMFRRDEGRFEELIAPVSLNRHFVSESHEHVSHVYFGSSSSNTIVPEKEHDQWKWCSYEDIDAMQEIEPDVAFYAKAALQAYEKK